MKLSLPFYFSFKNDAIYIHGIVCTLIYKISSYIYFNINMPSIDIIIDTLAEEESSLKAWNSLKTSPFFFF